MVACSACHTHIPPLGGVSTHMRDHIPSYKRQDTYSAALHQKLHEVYIFTTYFHNNE